ncbi:MAG: hypothetical protein ACK5U7_01095, partial [Bacteroidota bacterium]
DLHAGNVAITKTSYEAGNLLKQRIFSIFVLRHASIKHPQQPYQPAFRFVSLLSLWNANAG